jgi:hypothetical protein
VAHHDRDTRQGGLRGIDHASAKIRCALLRFSKGDNAEQQRCHRS